MKISKDLLKAMAVGLSVAVITPSCSNLKQKELNDLNETVEEGRKGQHDNSQTCDFDCPACGMG